MQALTRLTEIMRRLRDPQHGCPWDRQQDFRSIIPHTIEEAYELAEAVETGTSEEIRAELADLLFQVIFLSRLGEETGRFDLEAVAETLEQKLIARHPHVFGNQAPPDRERMKAAERHHAAGPDNTDPSADPDTDPSSILAGVGRICPALTRAARLQRRAAAAGFDWPELAPVLDKAQEELDELRAALKQGAGQSRLEEELGDLLFACVNLSRHLGRDPEAVLRAANRKFERRFTYIEARLRAQHRTPATADLEEMETLWQQAKAAEHPAD